MPVRPTQAPTWTYHPPACSHSSPVQSRNSLPFGRGRSSGTPLPDARHQGGNVARLPPLRSVRSVGSCEVVVERPLQGVVNVGFILRRCAEFRSLGLGQIKLQQFGAVGVCMLTIEQHKEAAQAITPRRAGLPANAGGVGSIGGNISHQLCSCWGWSLVVVRCPSCCTALRLSLSRWFHGRWSRGQPSSLRAV